MGFDKLFKRGAAHIMTDMDRKAASVLVVEAEATVRQAYRQCLVNLGYGIVSDAVDHLQALKKFEERPFSHIIFEAKKTTMPPIEFLGKVMSIDERMVTIAASWEPNVDDVFGLLIQGARGYLVKPFNQESLDEAIAMATKGEPISESILYAKNRNEALASLIMTALDKLTLAKRQSAQFETALREVPRREAGLQRAVDIGRTFAEGGPVFLLEAIVELCVERANGPATSLGRLRKRLEAKKGYLMSKQGERGEPSDAPENAPEESEPTP